MPAHPSRLPKLLGIAARIAAVIGVTYLAIRWSQPPNEAERLEAIMRAIQENPAPPIAVPRDGG